MGNKLSCCWSKNEPNGQSHGRRSKALEDKYMPSQEPEPAITASSRQLSSSTNLQHISEREPDDSEYDPSIHPKASTIFLSRSKSEIHRNNRSKRKSQYDNHRHRNDHLELDTRMTKKYSSCSTIFVDDSTVSQPNLKNTIKTVALAIYFHIKNRENRTPRELEGRLLDIFDEKLHPLTKDCVPDDYDRSDPEHKAIYRFIRTLFSSAQLTAECAIVTLVYLERLLTYAEIEIVPGNWRRIVLGAILLASKVWDDQAVWNVDYCQILKDISVEDMNELERQFLEMLQFNINVPSSVYAKYYFDLRALAEAHELTIPLEPLSKDRADKLEAMSNVIEDRINIHISIPQRRYSSLNALDNVRRPAKAILS